MNRLGRTNGVAFDARDLDEAADGVAGEAEVVLDADLGGVLDLFRRAAGTIAGLRRRTQRLVSEAQTPAEVDQILRAAKERADELLAGVLSSA